MVRSARERASRTMGRLRSWPHMPVPPGLNPLSSGPIIRSSRPRLERRQAGGRALGKSGPHNLPSLFDATSLRRLHLRTVVPYHARGKHGGTSMFRISFRISLLAGALALMPSLANAQSTRDVLRDFGLLGTWATDCAEPAGKSNFWTVYA